MHSNKDGHSFIDQKLLKLVVGVVWMQQTEWINYRKNFELLYYLAALPRVNYILISVFVVAVIIIDFFSFVLVLLKWPITLIQTAQSAKNIIEQNEKKYCCQLRLC